ncbi:2-oxoglutarate and iron-dependent oxygenase domain-containing protein ICU11-like [Helianthus annuus]|uniref:2-oxoglutarate and iron-dependent oxygenase domain-containing protein ICU11-like n=1 Tax=Helianthus annuus TaxID=4232 RepID=UPI000B9027F5|nr:2-oxoglutarate and iron-dependent oxygenase domain-containing protein ICU11-like [Helianthus annuus]XP_022006831.1 2-oxoglutarate and iron-dependent oxygenase domain-containing protein ICU11-like [Helianthus annuus]
MRKMKSAKVMQVKHFHAWAHNTDSSILRPNTGNGYGVSLDDIGMKATLDKLMEDYISLISRDTEFSRNPARVYPHTHPSCCCSTNTGGN